MKKWLLGFFLIFTLVGCGDEKYITAVKTIELTDVLEIKEERMYTVEDLIVVYMKRLTGDTKTNILNGLKYKIIGKMDNGKIVQAEYSGATVEIPVVKNGDYYQIMPLQIKGKSGYKRYSYTDLTREIVDAEMEKSMKEYEQSMEEYQEALRKELGL